MAILSASLLPHSPLLIPEVGKNNSLFLQKTSAAYQKISDQLKERGVEIVLVISPHGPNQENIFVFNTASEFSLSLGSFGFLNKKKISGDPALTYQLNQTLKADFPVQQTTVPNLDYGSAIPLYLLKEKNNGLKSIILYNPLGDGETSFRFGQALGALLIERPEKIAVIASGELSHRLKKSSPAGYSPKGTKFDNKIIEYLNDPQTAKDKLLSLDHKFVKDAGECGLMAILILMGILENLKAEAQVLAYQTDFGIGYLSLDFLLS